MKRKSDDEAAQKIARKVAGCSSRTDRKDGACLGPNENSCGIFSAAYEAARLALRMRRKK